MEKSDQPPEFIAAEAWKVVLRTRVPAAGRTDPADLPAFGKEREAPAEAADYWEAAWTER